MGERRRRRSSNEAKETLTSKQKANVNPMLLSLLHSTHRKFVVAVTGESASKLLLVILKLIFLLSIPHPVK